MNAALLAQLDAELEIDRFVDRSAAGAGRRGASADGARVFDAHDFVWKARRAPYDLVVYQLGNASCHDYMWAYLARYPGLVVLHDPRLHHARARQLLQRRRADDYRREFWYDHPDAERDFVEYAVAGLGGPIYYAWSMLRVVVETARLVAVHNPRVAADLREAHPHASIDTIRLGTPGLATDAAARQRVRARLGVADEATLFAAFGKITSEKRIGSILQAFGALRRDGVDAHLLLAGDASDYPALPQERAASGDAARVHVAGYVADEQIGEHLAAADACLCLRWPTALETSASWLQCLSARRPTVISDLAHTVDVPASVALRIDLLDEPAALTAAMRALAADARLRADLASAGYAYWTAHHTVACMADDYRRLLPIAAARRAPHVPDLPAHFTDDYTDRARDIARVFETRVDIL